MSGVRISLPRPFFSLIGSDVFFTNHRSVSQTYRLLQARESLARRSLPLTAPNNNQALIIFVAGIESALCHAIAETLGENLRLRCSRAS